jgi:hypothetical protein
MILEDTIEIKVSERNFKHYKNKGYIFEHKWDIITIKTTDLPETSAVKVLIKCDICGIEKELSYGDYNSNYKRNNRYVCKKCKSTTYKLTCNKLYGVDNVSQIESVKQQKIETCNKNFGVNHPMQSKIVMNKSKQTLQDVYDVINISQVPEIKERKRQKSLDVYGVDVVSKSKIVRRKMSISYIKTCQRKYGVNSTMLIPGIRKGWYKIKIYKNSDLTYQTKYELHFIEFCNINNIEIKNGIPIPYKINDENHTYYPDFYIPKYNLIIEIKSDYTYEKYKIRNLIKMEYTLKNNYNYLFVINKNYDELLTKYINII